MPLCINYYLLQYIFFTSCDVYSYNSPSPEHGPIVTPLCINNISNISTISQYIYKFLFSYITTGTFYKLYKLKK